MTLLTWFSESTKDGVAVERSPYRVPVRELGTVLRLFCSLRPNNASLKRKGILSKTFTIDDIEPSRQALLLSYAEKFLKHIKAVGAGQAFADLDKAFAKAYLNADDVSLSLDPPDRYRRGLSLFSEALEKQDGIIDPSFKRSIGYIFATNYSLRLLSKESSYPASANNPSYAPKI
jgi:hypothetical protein